MRKLNITIPEPCHEDWNTMARTKKGKFCSSCTKEVFDFTHYSDEQLIKRFSKEGDLCGRFTTNQLNRDLVLQRKKNHNYLSYAFTGLLSLLLLNSSSSKAQEKPTTNQTDKKFTSIPLQNTRATDSITVTGTVLDETNMPLPGATVSIKGTKNGTSTDFDGKFSLECKETDTLVISYVGYNKIEVKAITNIKISLTLYSEGRYHCNSVVLGFPDITPCDIAKRKRNRIKNKILRLIERGKILKSEKLKHKLENIHKCLK